MGLKCQGGRRDVGHKGSASMPPRVGKQGMPRQAHVNGHKEGCAGMGGHMQVTIVNTRRKTKIYTHLLVEGPEHECVNSQQVESWICA